MGKIRLVYRLIPSKLYNETKILSFLSQQGLHSLANAGRYETLHFGTTNPPTQTQFGEVFGFLGEFATSPHLY